MILRSATPDDIPQLLLAEQGVIAAERPMDSFLKEDPIYYYDLPDLINSENSELAVIEVDGRIVATGYAQIRESKAYWRKPAFAYLGFMYVAPDMRGKGLNQKVLDHLKHWAISKGITELRLDVYAPNASAIRAYEKAGFSNHMVEMRMEIS